MNRTIAVRYRAGVVGESQRQVHFCALDDAGDPSETWETYCGLRIPDDVAETADRPAGMPCLRCLTRTPALGGTVSGNASELPGEGAPPGRTTG
ncbi:hypothetical protein SAMN04487905_11348 [Actinopolyspora xinjiangensis]|uniref:Zinc-finger n=1 Tax=Actinopolyspora xinjiangensis TaxID=405564 RepID=A0A1H0WMQ6_9ACTN|nr:hypothetical protein [Actinopolyspora xinjiangensis]SDP91908.1 hypothetical protein SAMN04487905_11348 [Actinopolyspora xinjiangensis]